MTKGISVDELRSQESEQVRELERQLAEKDKVLEQVSLTPDHYAYIKTLLLHLFLNFMKFLN